MPDMSRTATTDPKSVGPTPRRNAAAPAAASEAPAADAKAEGPQGPGGKAKPPRDRLQLSSQAREATAARANQLPEGPSAPDLDARAVRVDATDRDVTVGVDLTQTSP